MTAISIAPVKGLALQHRHRVTLTSSGALGDRCFYLVDGEGQMVNAKEFGALSAVDAEYDSAASVLELMFPDGTTLSESVVDGSHLTTTFYERVDRVPSVCPLLSRALSDFLGATVTLVRSDPEHSGSDRGVRGVVSLVSAGSIELLNEQSGERLDSRRFRMLFEIDGLSAHAEDDLVGAWVRIGAALVRFEGHVGRCSVVIKNPETGLVDQPVLRWLRYRQTAATSEPIAFGIYGQVLEPGIVRVGDAVRIERRRTHALVRARVRRIVFALRRLRTSGA